MPVFKVGDKVNAKYDGALKRGDYMEWFHALIKAKEIGTVLDVDNALGFITARFPSHDVSTNGNEIMHIRKETYGTLQRRRQSKV